MSLRYWAKNIMTRVLQSILNSALLTITFTSTSDPSECDPTQLSFTLEEYQDFTHETAVYPDANERNGIEFMYVSAGLAGEAGKVANLGKKLYRDGMDREIVAAMMEELGDVLWYAARLCTIAGYSMASVMLQNWLKLLDRKARNVLHGRGSKR